MPSPRADVRLVLSNTKDEPLTVTARLGRGNRRLRDTTVELAPNETRVIDTERDFTGRGGRGAASRVEAISLEHAGANGALLARAMVQDERTGYSSTVQFSNPRNGKSSQYHGVGLRLGSVAGEPLSPVVVARNVGTTPTVLSGRMPYTTEDGQTGTVTVPDVRLAPGEMAEVDLERAIRRSRIEGEVATAGLEFEYRGEAGSVIVSAQSVSRSGNHVFRVPMWDPLAQRSPTGGYPFRLEENSSTVVYIKNITDREQQYVAHLVFAGGTYMLGMKRVAAHQTIEIDIRALRDGQAPDDEGRVIPFGVSRGQIKWSLRRTDESEATDPLENLALIGRSEQADTVRGISSNYSCQNCCSDGFLYGHLSPGGAEMEYGQQVQFRVYETYEDCYGFLNTVQTSADWTSSATNVASVNGSGVVTANGAGSVNIKARWRVTKYDPTQCDPGPYRVMSESDSQPTSDIQPLAPGCDPNGCVPFSYNYDETASVTVRPRVTIRNM